MATGSSPQHDGRNTGETAERSILQQAQAAASSSTAAETDVTRPTQDIDLLTTDAGDDELPPPAYGEAYGELRNEKDGLGTSASVADDGRVNIRINQLNRRLSQVFLPALRQPLEAARAGDGTPPPYIPSSLAGEKGSSRPPSLNVVMHVVGSRGDVQPFIALGKVLKTAYGHRVRVASHPIFRDLVEDSGLEFFSIGGDPSRLMAFMVKNPGLMPGFRSIVAGDVNQRRKDVGNYIQGCWRSCYEAGNGMASPEPSENELDSEPAVRPFVADCIIANPPSFAHIHCAEKLGIPLHIMFTMPYSPTQVFPHPLANIQSSNADPHLTNFVSYAMIELLSWQGLGDIINRFRKKCLGLDPVSLIWGPGMLQRLKVPHTYSWSPALIPKPADWGNHISISGFCFLDSPNYTPSSDLQAFLDSGSTPIYIGFGSIVLKDPDAVTRLIFEAVRRTGQRVLLSKGWGGIGAEEIPDGVFMLGNVPHDWLFKRVSCVVHHGGAGTTAAGLAAGRPTLVVPFFGDQPFWGAMVARAGAGPEPIPIKRLTARNLADAINFCLKPESVLRAKELASKITAEQGNEIGARSFHHHLQPDRLRCYLAPSRPAVWRIKRTKIRLSAFAACTLANANLLNFHDLKLYRPQEHYTDEGPWDPVSGGFSAVMRAFNGMAMGLAEIPSETGKALLMKPGSSRQSAPKSSQSSSLDSPQQSQTSLIMQESLARVRSTTDASDRSSITSNIGSTSISDGQQTRSGSSPGQSRVRSRVENSSNKDRDMLRPTGVHMTKGLGRALKAAMQSPMEISVEMTKGAHNAPKLWGDDTVRPQEKVSDLKSGLVAAGKEFGFGWYDGVTGLVMQPWNGAQKEGATGFLKGFGKGIGGFVAKPTAALMGVLGHTMKGVHKEVQKALGNNVQSYIIASRAAQGYEEWLQSSEADTQDVIARWKLVQTHQKKIDRAADPDEAIRQVLGPLSRTSSDDGVDGQSAGILLIPAQSVNAGDAPVEDSDSAELVFSRPVSPVSLAETIPEDSLTPSTEEKDDGSASGLQRAQTEPAENRTQQGIRRKPVRTSTAASSIGTGHGEREASGPSQSTTLRASEKSTSMNDKSPVVRVPPPSDPGHLAGTTQAEFNARQGQEQRTEKTAQEKSEEDIVLEYIKKQSVLEAQHQQSKGKARAGPVEDEDDEELQIVLKLSLQDHRGRYGDAPGAD